MKKLTLLLCVLLIATSTLLAQQETTATKRKAPFRANKQQISEAQTILIKNKTFEGEVDGKFSPEFRKSLKEFQSANGLKRTGTLNRATLEKLEIDLTDKQKTYSVNEASYDTVGNNSPPKKKRVVFRVNKDQITHAQQILTNKGMFDGEITGKYSKEFRSAIKDFQAANGLKRKGSLNRATLEKLEIPLTEKQEGIPVNPNDLASKSIEGKKRGPVFRATKDQISQAQTILKNEGLLDIEPTGKLNKATRAALKVWQSKKGIKKTGTLNKVTLESLSIELTDKQKNF